MNLDINSLMNSFQNMPDIMNKVQEELGKIKIIGSSGAGMVSIEFNGRGEAHAIDISSEAFENGKEFVEELIISAINDATNKRELAKMDVLKSISGLEGMFSKT